jgi:hypothetical protein
MPHRPPELISLIIYFIHFFFGVTFPTLSVLFCFARLCFPLIPTRQPPMKRSLSHENLGAETHGEMDTLETRIYAKDDTNEHRSL